MGFSLFLYYKGSYFALNKIKEVALNQFNTELNFSDAGFVNNQYFYIKDLHIKHPQFTFDIKKIKLLFKIYWESKLLEVQEVSIENTVGVGNFEIKNETNSLSSNKNEPPLWVKWLKDPPDFLQIHKIKIDNLTSTFTLKEQSNITQKNLKTFILKNADLILEPQLNKNNLNLTLWFHANPESSYQNKSKFEQQDIILNNLELKLTQTLHVDDKDLWKLTFSPFELKIQIKSAQIHQTSHNIFSDLAEVTLFLNTNYTFKTFNELNFLKPNDLDWKLSSHIKQIKSSNLTKTTNNKYNLFNMIPHLGTNFKLDSEGILKMAPPTDQRFQLPWSWQFKLISQLGPLQWNETKTQINLSTAWDENKGTITLKSSNNSPLNVSVKTILHKNQIQLKGQLETVLSPLLTKSLIDKKISGKISLPIELILMPTKNPFLKEVLLDTSINLKSFSMETENVSVKNMNGEIPIHEEIFLDLSQLNPSKMTPPPIENNHFNLSALSFKYIFQQNPFEKSDYDRLAPLFNSTNPLKIESILWKGQKYGPLNGVIELNQNYLSIHQFSIEFLQGSASGEFFLDLNPSQRRLGFLGRFIDIDLKSLLPTSANLASTMKPLKDAAPSNRSISARTGLELFIDRQTLEGRMDFNRLNKYQLLILLNGIDPNFKNNQFNKIRSLLEYGYPSQVNLSFHDGVADLKIDLESMGLKTHFDIPAISIQSFINPMIPITFKKDSNENSIGNTK